MNRVLVLSSLPILGSTTVGGGSVSHISSYSDLCRGDSVSPLFVPPSAICAEQPRLRLPYPTGDYTSPPCSVIITQAALVAAVTVHDEQLIIQVAGLPAASPPPLAHRHHEC
jgi:hypothetical protein